MTIALERPEDWKGSKAVLYDMSGKVILEQKMEGKNHFLNVANLTPGNYFLHLKTGKYSTTMQKLAVFH